MIRTLVFGIATAAVIVAAPMLLPAQAQDGKMAYQKRDDAMGTLSDNMKVLAAFVKEDKGSMAEVTAAAENVHRVAMEIPALFEVQSTPEGSRAKPEIWSDWDTFVKDAKALEDASNTLLMAAKAGDAQAVKAAFGKVGGSCGDCHKPFRAPKN